jgi:hypothetical protein
MKTGVSALVTISVYAAMNELRIILLKENVVTTSGEGAKGSINWQ